MKLKTILECESAISKLIHYGHLPVPQIFFISGMLKKITDEIERYGKARESLFIKHGEKTKDGGYTVSAGEKAAKFRKDESELLEQEVDISFPPEKITLCIQTIDETDRQLPPEKRLGFTAKDWLAIQEVIKVVETEE